MKYQTKTRVVEAITFDELVEYGRSVTPQNHLVNGMPWSFKFKGHHVTHENDSCYLILGAETDLLMTPGDMLILGEHGEIWTCMHDTFEAAYEPGKNERGLDAVHDEAIQAAAMAIRFVMHLGDYEYRASRMVSEIDRLRRKSAGKDEP